MGYSSAHDVEPRIEIGSMDIYYYNTRGWILFLGARIDAGVSPSRAVPSTIRTH